MSVSNHDWRSIVQVGSAPSTDTVEQCRQCGVVRHVYSYATLERQMSTVRAFFLGETVQPDDECRGLLRMLPECPEPEGESPEPLL